MKDVHAGLTGGPVVRLVVCVVCGGGSGGGCWRLCFDPRGNAPRYGVFVRSTQLASSD
jgi:hypothetical protein